jgi:hypothetical protein
VGSTPTGGSVKKKTKEFRDGEVLQTNRLYLALKAIGQCDDKGRSLLSVGYKGKFIAEPDMPLQTLLMPLIEEIMRFLIYTDDKSALRDLKKFKEWVDSIKLNEAAIT